MYPHAARKNCRASLLAVGCGVVLCLLAASVAGALEPLPSEPGFSGTLTKRVNGKRYQAQVFVQGDRLRVEHKYAIRTELGFAAIEIVRGDVGEIWYVLPQRKELLVTPMTDEVLPIRPGLIGETGRTPIGDAEVAGRAAQLFEVHTHRDSVNERFYEWVDGEAGVVLKLVSQDRDWSFEYERVRFSVQPDMYFDAPPGYQKRVNRTSPSRVE